MPAPPALEPAPQRVGAVRARARPVPPRGSGRARPLTAMQGAEGWAALREGMANLLCGPLLRLFRDSELPGGPGGPGSEDPGAEDPASFGDAESPPEHVRAAALALERAAHSYSTEPGLGPEPRPSYPHTIRLINQRLGAQIGPYPDDVAGLMLLRGDREAPWLVGQLLTLDAPEPREVIRRMFLRTLLRCPGFAGAEDRALALTTSVRVEMGCFNAAVRTSKESEDPPRRQWDSPGFVSIYSARCGAIVGLLDPESQGCRLYRAGLADRLRSGEVAPEAVGGMSERALCPLATAKERAEILERSVQKVVMKESSLFRCPYCKERRCTYESRQFRALDEAATFKCKCLACGQPFTGHS